MRARQVVAFSCKGRGFCPSCGGRRMAHTAAHLVDRVLPEVPCGMAKAALEYGETHAMAEAIANERSASAELRGRQG